MPSYRDEVVVLRTQKLGEADRIVTLLTRWHGRVRAVAKGVRRTSSKFGARLEPFMVADAQLYIGRSLDVVQQVDTIGAYGAEIAVDYERFTAANAMAETADRLGDADATPQQYLLLVGGLRSLSKGEHAPREVMNSYLLRTMSLSGWAPSLDACARCGAVGPHDAFVAQLGGAVCPNCAPVGASTIRPDVTRHLRALLQGEWETVETSTEGTTHAAAGVITAYAQFHLERGIRSLSQVGTR